MSRRRKQHYIKVRVRKLEGRKVNKWQVEFHIRGAHYILTDESRKRVVQRAEAICARADFPPPELCEDWNYTGNTPTELVGLEGRW